MKVRVQGLPGVGVDSVRPGYSYRGTSLIRHSYPLGFRRALGTVLL